MKTNINLLPWRFRKRLLFRVRFYQWAAVWGICMAIVGTAVMVEYRLIQGGHTSIQEQRQKSALLVSKQNENVRILRKLKGLRTRLAYFQEFENKEYPFNLVSLISQSAVNSDHRIQIETLSYSKSEHAAEVATKTTAPRGRHTSNVTNGASRNGRTNEVRMVESSKLLLSGIAVDDLAVARLIVTLRDSGVFQKVELKSTDGVEVAGNKVRRYQVECSF